MKSSLKIGPAGYKTVRKHDSLYLKVNNYENPKQSHLDIIKLIKKNIKLKKKLNYNGVIVDFGCANGELLYNIRKQFKKANLYGVDILPELIEKSKTVIKENNKTKFIIGSVLKKNLFNPKSVNISILSGVLSIFDEFETALNNLIRFTKKKGHIFIFSLFSNYPVDVFVKYRKSTDYNKKEIESGWNIISKYSISKYLKKNARVKKFYFNDFSLKFELKQNKKDCVRSWTFKDINKKNIVTNGLNLILPQSILHIELN